MISSLELAKLCGVSQGTVDRALHGRGRISPATREKVLRAARRYGYSPHPAARELMTGKSTIVSAVVPGIRTEFFMDMLECIRLRLHDKGLRLLLSPVSTSEQMLDALRDFAARRVRAQIVIPPQPDIRIPRVILQASPLYALIDSPSPSIPLVAPDEIATGRRGTKYLLARGHRRILFLTYGRRSGAVANRRRGYREAMRERGATPRVMVAPSKETLHRALAGYRPTALFCHNDWLALSAIRALAHYGVRVPDDISVLGIDNSPSFTALCPDITTLEYPISQIASRLVAAIDGEAVERPFEPLRLVDRGSVRCTE